MNIDKLFEDKKYLEHEINFFITKKHIKKNGTKSFLILIAWPIGMGIFVSIIGLILFVLDISNTNNLTYFFILGIIIGIIIDLIMNLIKKRR